MHNNRFTYHLTRIIANEDVTIITPHQREMKRFIYSVIILLVV